jgi:hypothetical protein
VHLVGYLTLENMHFGGISGVLYRKAQKQSKNLALEWRWQSALLFPIGIGIGIAISTVDLCSAVYWIYDIR